MSAPGSPGTPTLRRALGRWDLTAFGVNAVIGGGIYVWPAQVAAQIGTWSPLAYIAVGFVSLSVALCFAEVSSRFDTTGGAYLYARAAFGDFVGFEVGWMQWFTRAASQATIMAAMVVALGYYFPRLTAGWPRALFLLGLTTVLARINARGVRHGALVVNVLTIAKLAPLIVFVALGLAFVQPQRLTELPVITIRQALGAGLLLVLIYGGYEVIPVPAFFARVHPRYGTPVTAIVFTSAVAVTLALSVSFVGIAVISALSRLLTYGSTAAATLRLRSHPGGADVKPATFVAPLGSTAPILAICVCVALTAGATRQQLLGGAAALAAGAVLHAVNGLFARRQQTVPTA